MSMRYKGAVLSATAPTTGKFSGAKGIWSLRQQAQAQGTCTWPILAGCQTYTVASTYTWVAPAGVTSVSVVAIGGGGGGISKCVGYYPGGGGGGLGYKNNYSVTPGNSYTVVVGYGGCGRVCGAVKGGDSYFYSTSVIRGYGGCAGGGGSYGGTFTGCGGSTGGFGYAGGGGAAGYTGAGGAGGDGYSNKGYGPGSGAASFGGGGGGGGAIYTFSCTPYGGTVMGAGGGGGTGIYGVGTTTVAGGGTSLISPYIGFGGSGGSGGSGGGCGFFYGGGGGPYGGGGGYGAVNSSCGCNPIFYAGGTGGRGAVRIVWPGNQRSFPSTNVGA